MLIYEIFNIFIFILILASALTFTINFSKNNNLNLHLLIIIFFWHLFFSLVYYVYSLIDEADAFSYYFLAKYKSESFVNFYNLEPGANFIFNLCYFLGEILSLSYLNVFIIFNFIGFLGIIFFILSIDTIKNIKNDKSLLYIIILFIPSFSFWSSGIGKDVFSFLAVNLFIWSSINFKEKIKFTFLSILIMFLVRPHIAVIMSVGLLFAFSFNREIKRNHKLLFLILFAILFVPLLYSGINYVNIEIDIYSLKRTYLYINEFIVRRMSLNISETAGIDLKSMNLIEIIFNFYFRPLPFDAKNLFQVVISIENIVLLFFFSLSLFFILINFRPVQIKYSSKSMLWIYIIITTLLLSLTQANYGITSRQKWMVLPVLLFIFYHYLPSKVIINAKYRIQKKI